MKSVERNFRFLLKLRGSRKIRSDFRSPKGLFQQGGEVFAGWVSGIIPLLVVLMTGITAVIKLIGEERVNTAARWASKNIITRYTLLPILAVLFLTNPIKIGTVSWD